MSRKRTYATGLICVLTLLASCDSGVDSPDTDTSRGLLGGGVVCGTANQGGIMTLACPYGQRISSVGFASYGTPSGTCGAFKLGTCNASNAASVVSEACMGKSSCKVRASRYTFGDPCVGTAKRLYVQAACTATIDGGTSGAGGASGTGGSAGTGGASSTGGTPSTGGSTSAVGGTLETGGKSGAGGSTGTGGVTTGNCNNSRTLQLVGNQIRDTSGATIVARGPELVTASTDQTAAIDSAASQGANAIRLLLTLDAANGMTPAGFDNLIGRAVSHNMVIWLSLFVWDTDNNYVIGSALGGGNFYALAAPDGNTCSKATPAPCYLAVWSRQWLKDLVAKYEGHVIIDAAQEYIGVADPSTEAGRAEWANAAQTNIRWFRSAGYAVPLEIMANYQGRDLYGIVQKGDSIRAVDTVVIGGAPQTMFGWQAYWASDWYKSWQGGLLLGGSNSITGAQAIHQFAVTQPFPIQIGLDNYAGDTSTEYKAEMDQAAADHASWLWWSWTGSNTVECPNDGATCQAYVTGSQSGFAGAVRSACGL